MKSKLDLSFTAAQLATAGTVVNNPREGDYGLISNFLVIVAELTGLTGGTLDVTIQDSADGVTWFDYVRFATVSAGAALARTSFIPVALVPLVAVGKSVDPATPIPILAAGATRGGWPMSYLRAVAVAGAGTTAGAIQTISVLAR